LFSVLAITALPAVWASANRKSCQGEKAAALVGATNRQSPPGSYPKGDDVFHTKPSAASRKPQYRSIKHNY